MHTHSHKHMQAHSHTITITAQSSQHCEWEETFCQAHSGLRHQGVWNLKRLSSHSPTALLQPQGVECHLLAKQDFLIFREEGFNMAHQCRTCGIWQPWQKESWRVKCKWIRNRWIRYLLKHTWVLQLREEGGLGDSFGKNVLDSAAPYWTVWWTQNMARVNLPLLMGNI